MVVFFIVFIVLLAIGMPIAFSLAIPTVCYLLVTHQTEFFPVLAQQAYAGANSFTLMAAPLFLLAGEFMNISGITDALEEFCDLILGRLRGGLAYVNIMGSTIFAGISGSAISDVMSIGQIEIKTMTEQGYPVEYAAALTVSSSVVGPIIPPSIMAAIYCGLTGCSLGGMFAAGYLPGLLISLALAILVFFQAKKYNFPKRTYRYTIKEAKSIIVRGSTALALPVIMVGGMLGGFFTPTEAAIVGCLYALILGLIKREIHFRDIIPTIIHTMKNSGALLLLISFAYILAWTLSYENISVRLGNVVMSVVSNPTVFLIIVMCLVLIAGMWMEVGTIIVVLVPVLYPVALQMGIHPMQFGLVIMLAASMGVSTPPVGVCLYAAASIANIPANKMYSHILRFLAVQIVAVLLVILFPGICLTLPKLFGFI